MVPAEHRFQASLPDDDRRQCRDDSRPSAGSRARSDSWRRTRWAQRLLALGVVVPITTLSEASTSEVDRGWGTTVTAVTWLVTMSALYVRYRHLRPDLFVLAAGVLATIAVVTSVLIRIVLANNACGVGLFLVAAMIVGLSAVGATWLRNVAARLDGGGQ